MSNNPFPPGASIVAYLRDSGGVRQDQSLPQQERQLRSWCNENGYTLTQVFKDEASSGSTTVGREGFSRMIAHFHNNVPEAGLVLWSYDRFARDFDDAQYFKADLRRRGYLIHALTDQIPEGPIGRLIESVIDWKNQQYLIDLSNNIKRGMFDNITIHGCAPGTTPAGYRPVPVKIGERRDGTPHTLHRWELDPETAPLVIRAFQMRAGRSTYKEIHAEVHLHKYQGSYRTMFRNPIYYGELHYGDLVVPDFVEPLIEKKLWEAVQQVTHFYRQLHAPKFEDSLPGGRYPKGVLDHPRRINSPYLLSGLAYCGHCGTSLSGRTIKKRGGGRWHYYRCPNLRLADDPCPGLSIPKAALEDHVIATITEIILQPDHLQELYRAEAERTRESTGDIERQVKRLERQRTQARKQIANITAAIREHGHSRALLNSLGEIERKLAAQDLQIQALQGTATEDEISPEELERLAGSTAQALRDADNSRKRKILRSLVHRINVVKENDEIRGKITYYAPTITPENGIYTFTNPPPTVPSHRHNHSFTIKRP